MLQERKHRLVDASGLFAWWGLVAVVLCGITPPAKAQEPSAPVSIDAVSYCQIDDLRDALHLRNEDLAAMGCSEESATAVLTGLRNWYESSKQTLEEATTAESLKRQELRALMQQMGSGTGDAGTRARVVEARRQLDEAQKGHQAVIEDAAKRIQGALTGSQSAIWQTVRANGAVAGRYRYVPDLTGEQIEALNKARRALARRTAAAKTSDEAAAAREDFAKMERDIMGSGQATALERAEQNIAECLGGVLKAAEGVLPVPEELRPELSEDETHQIGD